MLPIGLDVRKVVLVGERAVGTDIGQGFLAFDGFLLRCPAHCCGRRLGARHVRRRLVLAKPAPIPPNSILLPDFEGW